MMADVKGLVEYVARSLVENQEAVEVTQIHSRHGLVIRLHVAPDDMGRVIGKDGRIANAIRALARIHAHRGDRVSLDID
jgi:predicted RNA-binding protein YlqC (UPF0109 family)